MSRDWQGRLRRAMGRSRPGPAPAPAAAPAAEPEENALFEDLPGVLDSLNEATRQFNEAARGQGQISLELASALHELAASSEEFVASARAINRHAEAVEDSATECLAACGKGEKTLAAASVELNSLNRQMTAFVAGIQTLAGQNRQISGIAAIIAEISTQLDLLALNAQLEAAGAGPAGRRFAVVAEEVKRLAGTSQTATEHIQKIVRQILAEGAVLAEAAAQALATTESSLRHTDEVSEGLAEISAEVGQTHRRSQEIKLSTREQAASQQQLAQSIAAVDALAGRNADAAGGQLENAITHLSDLAQYLTLILESTVLGPSPAAPH